MPLPAIAAPLISAVGAGLQIGATQKLNKQTREWNEKMYAKQRADSLSDWAMQNEYNSPTKQMQRLQEAGLNPNLVYGTGSVVANSQSMPRATEMKSWNPQTPQFSFDNSIQAYQDTRIKGAQYDNLMMQQTLMAQDLIGKTLDNRKKAVDAGLKEQLRQVSVDMAYYSKDLIAERLNRIRQIQDMDADRFPLQQDILKQRLQEAVLQVAEREQKVSLTTEQVNKIKKEIELMEKNGQLKDLEIKMREKGLSPGDPWYFRIGARIYDNIFGN